jgi:hypothetical protein
MAWMTTPELNDRIAVIRDNLRQLVEKAAASSGAQDEERTSERIAQQQEQLDKLVAERDAMSEKIVLKTGTRELVWQAQLTPCRNLLRMLFSLRCARSGECDIACDIGSPDHSTIGFASGHLGRYCTRRGLLDFAEEKLHRTQLPRVFELRDLVEHSSSPDAYFRNFEESLSAIPQKIEAVSRHRM